MPSITLPLTPQGAVVRLAIMVSTPRQNSLIAAKQPVPAPVIANEVVDTGASCTCIDPALLTKLGLAPSGVTNIHTPTTAGIAQQCNQYDVDITVILGNGRLHVIRSLPVIGSALSSYGIDGLLGRDVISQGILIYNGEHNEFTLSF